MGPSPSNPVDLVINKAPAYRSACRHYVECWVLSQSDSYWYLGEDVEQNCQYGEVDSDPLTSKPQSEILRHGEDPTGHVDRHKAPPEKDEVENGLMEERSCLFPFPKSGWTSSGLTLSSKPDIPMPEAAPVPARPMKCPEPMLLANKEAPTFTIRVKEQSPAKLVTSITNTKFILLEAKK